MMTDDTFYRRVKELANLRDFSFNYVFESTEYLKASA